MCPIVLLHFNVQLPSNMFPLAAPPNFSTVTRDVYTENVHFTEAFVVRVLTSVTAACMYIHEHHMMHGDLYAHNLLVDTFGNVKLCDFGAAFFYNAQQSYIFERLETRAFGCLIEELLSRSTCCANVQRSLQQLCNDCVCTNVLNRPLFVEISKRLEHIVSTCQCMLNPGHA